MGNPETKKETYTVVKFVVSMTVPSPKYNSEGPTAICFTIKGTLTK